MRPVTRGARPHDSHGQEIEFKEYADARGELIHRLGEYCSYCEMHLDSSLAVEHVQPKQPPGAAQVLPERELDWHNFLLACTNCNSTKGNSEVALDDYLWPDRDNTFRALCYSEGGRITAAENIEPGVKRKAEQTIKLTGLDKEPLNNPKASDRRWENRRETWDIAQRSKKNLQKCNIQEMRDQIVMTATGHAYWSVWMTVFKDDADMLHRLLNAFPGTSTACFDASAGYLPVTREGGQC